MVSEAEVRKSPTQRFTDRFQRVFVLLVLLLVVGLLFAGISLDEPFRDSFYRAMAVLVAASPGALGDRYTKRHSLWHRQGSPRWRADQGRCAT
jgi:cation transport ATPase